MDNNALEAFEVLGHGWEEKKIEMAKREKIEINKTSIL